MLPTTFSRCTIPRSYYPCSVELIFTIQGPSTGVTNGPTVPGTEGFLRGFTGGGISVPKQENRKKPVARAVPGTGTS